MSEFDPEELLPAADPDDPDDLLAAGQLLDGENDIEIGEELVPLGRAWAFDFERGEFQRDGHAPATIRDNANLVGWIEKCLRTHRGAAVVHPLDYGIANPMVEYLSEEPEDTTELENDIVEALTVHPYIKGIEDIEIEEGETLEGDGALGISFVVALADGDDVDVDLEVSIG